MSKKDDDFTRTVKTEDGKTDLDETADKIVKDTIGKNIPPSDEAERATQEWEDMNIKKRDRG